MRLIALAVAAFLTTTTLGVAAAQTPEASSGGAAQSPAVDAPTMGLPVSIDRIREALALAPERSLLVAAERQVDGRPRFSLTVQERLPFKNWFDPEDFKVPPAPGGGVYGNEQERLLNNSIQRPLSQPYAAFSGGQLITIAIQNLLGKYVAGPLLAAMTAAQRADAQAAAKAEVEASVAEYCASLMRAGQHPEFCDGRTR